MGHGKKWRDDEDLALAAAYVALTSAGMKTGYAFWEALRARLESVRSARAHMNRWILISQDVKTFVECLGGDECEEEDVDVELETFDRAKRIFQEKMGRTFEFEACWKIVRNCPKFRTNDGQRDETPMARTVTSEMQTQAPVVAPATDETSTTVAAVKTQETAEQMDTLTDNTKTVTETSTAVSTVSTQETSEVEKVTESPIPTATMDLTVDQQQLTNELRRKNDLHEDELAMKLFGNMRESEESQRFFKLLKRKKLLLLEQQVDELEQAQQRRRQRRS